MKRKWVIVAGVVFVGGVVWVAFVEKGKSYSICEDVEDMKKDPSFKVDAGFEKIQIIELGLSCWIEGKLGNQFVSRGLLFSESTKSLSWMDPVGRNDSLSAVIISTETSHHPNITRIKAELGKKFPGLTCRIEVQ